MVIDGAQIVVSRKWNSPQIRVELSKEGIDIRMDINDFIVALKKEIQPATRPEITLPRRVFQSTGSRKKLEVELATASQVDVHRVLWQRIDAAVLKIVKEMKDSTLQAVHR